MFETFGVKGLFIGIQATLALFSQVCGPNSNNSSLTNMQPSDLTGIVVDSGDGVTHVFPVADGFVIGSCVQHIPLAGRDITKFIRQQLIDRKEKVPGEDAMEIARSVKEKYGYVCKDLVSEYKKFDEKKKGDDGKWYLSNKFKKYIHKPSSGAAPVEIDVGYERFLGPEMFFHPVSCFANYLSNYAFYFRNSSIKISELHWMRLLIKLFSHVQWTIVESFIKTSLSLAVVLYSTTLTKDYKNLFNSALTIG